MMTMARRYGLLGFAFLPLLSIALGGACATGITIGSGGAGGGSGGSPSTSSTGNGGSDAGKPDAPPGPCTMAVDCTGLTDPCNVGTCVNGTCVKAPANDLGGCDDGQFCTENDVCMSGVCMGGSPKSCSPPDSCHLGACDEATDTCSSTPGNDGAQCDDLDACTLAGTCLGGQCQKGPPVNCSVLNTLCSVGQCMPGQGCVAVPANNGMPCNDQLYCTDNDQCQNAKCTGTPKTCAPPNNNCQVGICNEALKTCSVTVAPNGTACDDQNNCTMSEACQNGMCTGGQPANNGAVCDDKNGCTTGTTCANGLCGNAQSTINMCINNDSCCPANCSLAQDNDCLYWAPGVLQNVPPATLTGWQVCYTDNYNVSMDNAKVDQILLSCPKARLMLTCRKNGAANYQLAAMGIRADVLFDCGSNSSCTHQANGVGWYFSKGYSWGFANGGDAVTRNQCDTAAGSLRLCWHTLAGVGGYRCGANVGLNSDATWERQVLQGD